VNATVVIWAVFLKAVHFKPIMRPARRVNLKILSVKVCGLVGMKSRSDGLVIDIAMMAMSIGAMLHVKSGDLEVVVVERV
jgi:hypothetical protein